MNKISYRYIKVPNEIFQMDLSVEDISIYCFLCSCTEKFNPSTRYIAKVLKIAPKTVRKGLTNLVDNGMILVIDKGCGSRAKKMSFLPVSAWRQNGNNIINK